MARLIYSSITSLDGYVADESGSFDWSVPDDEVHSFVNDLQRAIGTHLYGRRLYDVLKVWDTMPLEGEPEWIADYARIWRDADKVVFSRTLNAPESSRTSIDREFDPTAVSRLVRGSASDVLIGGPELAGQALSAGIVDEVQQFLSPVVVGGGTHFLPKGLRVRLELLDERRFGNGVVYLRYAVRHS